MTPVSKTHFGWKSCIAKGKNYIFFPPKVSLFFPSFLGTVMGCSVDCYAAIFDEVKFISEGDFFDSTWYVPERVSVKKSKYCRSSSFSLWSQRNEVNFPEETSSRSGTFFAPLSPTHFRIFVSFLAYRAHSLYVSTSPLQNLDRRRSDPPFFSKGFG